MFFFPLVQAIGRDKGFFTQLIADRRKFTLIAQEFALGVRFFGGEMIYGCLDVVQLGQVSSTNRFEYIKFCALGGLGTPAS